MFMCLVVLSSSWISLQGFHYWMVSTHSSLSQSLHLSILPPSTSLPASPLLLLSSLSCVFTALLLPSHLPVSPSATRPVHCPSVHGVSQGDSCYSYRGMKLPLHPLRAPKRCSTVEKFNTNIGRKEGKHRAEENTMLIICLWKQRDAVLALCFLWAQKRLLKN